MNNLSLKTAFALNIQLVTGDKYLDGNDERIVGAPVSEETINTPSHGDGDLFVSEFIFRQNELAIHAEGSGRKSLPCDSSTPLMIKWPNGMIDVQTAYNVDWNTAFQWKPYLLEILKMNIDDIATKSDEEDPESPTGAVNYWRGVIELYKFEPEAFAVFLAKTMNNVK
ncbi:hypothetical protein NVP1205O_61 [Vibrio phage 1.205.O._10N.222.51.A7]|nr:hypothetical protein NVP1205O_61 [Vibrio phage 1.205.O._10N.222.51.A7]